MSRFIIEIPRCPGLRRAPITLLLGFILLMLALPAGPLMAQSPDAAPPADAGVATSSAVDPNKKIDLVFRRQKIEMILASIQAQSGVKVIAQGKTAGQALDILVQQVTVEESLNQIIAGKDWLWRKLPTGEYEIWDKASFRAQVLPTLVQQRTFQLSHVTAEDAAKAIRGVLTKDIGNVAVEPRTNKLIVTDLPQVLEAVERLLAEIDVDLIFRVFYIRHADVGVVADKLKLYKSAPGTIEIDERTHQILVEDNQTAIQQMEMLVQILDVGPEMKVYDVHNVGVDSEGLEDLRAAIERVITKDAFFEINSMQGNFVLEDVPEVHEKVEKLLRAFDRTPKQVFIEAEVLDIGFGHNFKWGLQYQASEDLFSAHRDNLLRRELGGDIFDPGSGDESQDLGFLNLGGEFPVVEVAGGLVVEYLDDSIHAILSTSLADSRTRVLSQPRLPVKNQEEAELFIGSEEPYLNTVFTTSNVNNVNSVAQQTLTAGLRLKFTPTITNNGLIELKIDISNDTTKDAPRTYQGESYTLIGRNRQNAVTTMIVPSGSTRIIAGLSVDSYTGSEEGVPVLMKIPVIGKYLFSNIEKKQSQGNIMFFVTPTILEEKAPFDRKIDRAKKITDLTLDDILVNDQTTTGVEALLAKFGQAGAAPGIEEIKAKLLQSEAKPLALVSEQVDRLISTKNLSPIPGPDSGLGSPTPVDQPQDAGPPPQPTDGNPPPGREPDAKEEGDKDQSADADAAPVPIDSDRGNAVPEGTETDY